LAALFKYASGMPKTAPPEEAGVCLFLYFHQQIPFAELGGLIVGF
jgi:hypothetical protein